MGAVSVIVVASVFMMNEVHKGFDALAGRGKIPVRKETGVQEGNADPVAQETVLMSEIRMDLR